MNNLIDIENMTPKQIVLELDKYIIGQDEAKKSVAIAMRNRIRRQKLSDELKKEVIPKNILMIGPTGVGKTEIARRLAQLSGSPFMKVEATRFTEVGYVGKNVDSMIRELTEVSVNMVKNEKMKEISEKTEIMVEERILDSLVPIPSKKGQSNVVFSIFQNQSNQNQPKLSKEQMDELKNRREKTRQDLRNNELENFEIEIEIEEKNQQMMMIPGMEDMGMDISGMLGAVMPKKTKKKRLTVSEARKVLTPIEAEKLLDMDKVIIEAFERVENRGILFVDEIDKVVNKSNNSADVSREGVQRDLLPIIEGTTINTKYGPIKTDHILFIAAGAFHISKPSDLIPEFQGRFPIRVELKALTQVDFFKILKETKNAIIKQYKALLATEKVDINFEEEGLKEIAKISFDLNSNIENIGARRLYTVIEKVLEEISFKAPDVDNHIVIDKEYVSERVKSISEDRDLSSYIL